MRRLSTLKGGEETCAQTPQASGRGNGVPNLNTPAEGWRETSQNPLHFRADARDVWRRGGDSNARTPSRVAGLQVG